MEIDQKCKVFQTANKTLKTNQVIVGAQWKINSDDWW